MISAHYKAKIIIPICLCLGWGWFVLANSKSRLDYFFRTVTPISIGEEEKSSAENSRLFFSGFSSDEGGFRWSNEVQQQICFKLKGGDPGINKYVIAYNINVVELLVGKNIITSLDGIRRTHTCASSICVLEFVVDGINFHDKNHCITVKLPLTVTVPNDDRQLGYQFKSIILKK